MGTHRIRSEKQNGRLTYAVPTGLACYYQTSRAYTKETSRIYENLWHSMIEDEHLLTCRPCLVAYLSKARSITYTVSARITLETNCDIR